MFARGFLVFVCWIIPFAVSTENVEDAVFTSNGTHLLQLKLMPPRVQTVGQIGDHVMGLAADADEKLLFWSDIGFNQKGIYRSTLNGRQITKIVSDISLVTGMTVDWTTKRVIWTDSRRQTIESSSYKGTSRQVIVYNKLKRPKAVVVDPLLGFIYWADQGSRRIERVHTDGSQRQLLYKRSKFWPNQLTIDTKNRMLYCVDGYHSRIMFTHLNSPTKWRNIDFKSRHIGQHIFGVAVHQSAIYLSTWYKTSILIYNTTRQKLTRRLFDVTSKRLYYLVSTGTAIQPKYSNPCELGYNGNCSHICLVTGRTTYKCSCPTYGGLVLASDEKTCSEPADILLYTVKGSGIVAYISADINKSPVEQHIVSRSTMPVAVAFDPINKVVFWSDVKELVIYQANLDGSNKREFMTQGVGVVDGMALDYIHGRLYFSNMFMTSHGNFVNRWSSVESVNVDGSDWLTITTDVGKPRALTLDLERRFLYISDWGQEPKIVRCNLDGSNAVTIKTADISNPNGLAVQGDLLYVADSNYDGRAEDAYIAALNVTSNTWQYLPSLKLKIPFGISAFNNSLIIADWYNGDAHSGRISLYNVQKHRMRPVIKGVRSPSNIVYGTLRQQSVPLSAHHQCSDLYFELPDGTTGCACPTDGSKVLSVDMKTCKEPENFLLVVDVNVIYLISLDPFTSQTPHRVVKAGYDANIIAATFDPTDKLIYWADGSRRYPRIFCQHLNGSSYSLAMQIKVPGGVVDGIAVDVATNTLVMVGYNHKYGFIATASTQAKRIITMTKVIGRPRGVAVHDGFIYWSDILNPGRIIRMSTIGKKEVLADTGFKWPNSIAIHDGLLYVGDGQDRKIAVMNLDGTNRRELDFFSHRFQHIFGMVVFNEFILYTDWVNHTLGFLDMKTGAMTTMVSNMVRPTTLTIHHPKSLQVLNSCKYSGCSDGCVNIPGGSYCTCPAGQHLMEDGVTCSQGHMKWLPSSRFRCESVCHKKALCGHLASTKVYHCVCQAGYYGDGITHCQACHVNSYKASLGNSSCEMCPSDSSTHEMEGSATCHCEKQGLIFKYGSCYNKTTPMFPSTQSPSSTTEFVSTSSPVTREVPTLTPRSFAPTSIPLTTTAAPSYFENCPSGQLLTLVLPPNSSSVKLNLTLIARDDKGTILSVSSNHDSVYEWSGSGNNGHQHVKYWAEDNHGQIVTCAFVVYVLDDQPPQFTYCPRDIAVSTTLSSVEVYWSEASATDNDGIHSLQASTKSGSRFNSGETQVVNYTATDKAGNMALCSFTVDVNKDRVACNVTALEPEGGALVCALNDLSLWQCNILCDYRTHVLNPRSSFKDGILCADNGWMNVFPERHVQNACLEKSIYRRLSRRMTFTFRGPCRPDNDSFVNTVKTSIMSFLPSAIIGHLCPFNTTSHQRECAEFNVFCHHSTTGKQKRHANTGDWWEVDINFKFTISNDSTLSEALDIMNSTMNEMEHMLNEPKLTWDTPVPVHEESFEIGDLKFDCNEGHIYINDSCVACPQGTYMDLSSESCQDCPSNQYQDLRGQLECKPCPQSGHSTPGSYFSSECTSEDTNNHSGSVWLALCISGGLILCIFMFVGICCWLTHTRNKITVCDTLIAVSGDRDSFLVSNRKEKASRIEPSNCEVDECQT